MKRTAALRRDLQTLYALARHPGVGRTHAERLDSFYRRQADDYDRFRQGLLHGRAELFCHLTCPDNRNAVWIDMGAGTGANLALRPELTEAFSKIYVVDLCSSLLKQAAQRIEYSGWHHVHCVHADATAFQPEESGADLITFSYSLTMMPDWIVALEHAARLLRPGGQIGVVDFSVAPKFPRSGRAVHSWLTRTLWPIWFARDNVFLSSDHLRYLESHYTTLQIWEDFGRVPYFFGFAAPYYYFIGQKTAVTKK